LTAPLANKVGYVRSVLGVVLIPTTIEQGPVVFCCDIGDINNFSAATNQILSQRFMISRCWFKSVNTAFKAVLNKQIIRHGTKFLETFNTIVKDQSLPESLAVGCAKKRAPRCLEFCQRKHFSLGTGTECFAGFTPESATECWRVSTALFRQPKPEREGIARIAIL